SGHNPRARRDAGLAGIGPQARHYTGPRAGSGCAFSHTGKHSITLLETMWFNGELYFLGEKQAK
ncbi:MAG TPA: hypothetical protein VL527_03870, partial [Dongiaceae bacterium]|nr:hypothetical protein [Dongiaceae bacterium]